MANELLYLLACTVLCAYCTGASWLLQVVAYPGYRLVGEAEFVPYHIDFGKRLIPVTVAPMVLTNLLLIGLVFYHPATIPAWATYVAAACSLVILGTTFALEIPKHARLDREGKSLAVIDGLVRDNLPRSLAWTTASAVLVYAWVG